MKTENRRGNRNMPMNLKCVSHQILVESHPIPLHSPRYGRCRESYVTDSDRVKTKTCVGTDSAVKM